VVHESLREIAAAPRRGLTLPSRGRPQAGFAHLRPPLMSNVRRRMRLFIVVIVCASLAACSRYLEVRVLNASGAPLTVCSFNEKPIDCTEVSNHDSAVLKWRNGVFLVQAAGCSSIYRAPALEAIEDYRRQPREPINAVIDQDRLILIVPNGRLPEEVTAVGQPPGFPIKPLQEQAACK